MIQNKSLSLPIFQKSKIVRAVNPYRNVVIRLLLYNEKYYWVAMMDYEYNSHDTYYVGKDLKEATKIWEDEKDVWGKDKGGFWN